MTRKQVLVLAIPGLLLSAQLVSNRAAYGDLVRGDVALIGYRASVIDEFSMLALKAISSGEVFYFTDVAVNGAALGSAEALWSVTTTTALSAGTTLTFRDLGSAWSTPQANLAFVGSGPYSNGFATASFSSSVDQLLLLDSSDGGATEAASTNLFAIDPFPNVPRGLSEGEGKITRVAENIRYTGTYSGTAEALFTAISDIANWSSFTDASLGATSFHGAYSITAVPEPAAYLSLLVILGPVGLARGSRHWRNRSSGTGPAASRPQPGP